MRGGALWLVPRGEGGGASCCYVSVSIYFNFCTFNEACCHIHQDNDSFRINPTNVIMFFFIFNRRSQRSQTLQKHLSWYQNIRVQFWASVTLCHLSRLRTAAWSSAVRFWVWHCSESSSHFRLSTQHSSHTIIICACEVIFLIRVL